MRCLSVLMVIVITLRRDRCALIFPGISVANPRLSFAPGNFTDVTFSRRRAIRVVEEDDLGIGSRN